MKDIPMFTTDFGMASLLLKEVPYRAVAYVRVHSFLDGKLREHLDRCISFCRMVGAQAVFATGAEELSAYPHHCTVLRMSGSVSSEEESSACLWPVTAETAQQWREIYNQRMARVDNATTLTAGEEKDLMDASFVHENGELLGIGWIRGEELLALASVKPGSGRRVLEAMIRSRLTDRITLEVASTNHRAIRLYERVGLIVSGEVSRWYKIF